MKTILDEIRKNIQNSEYKNKEHIRISLICHLLHELGWDLWNPGEVYPHFAISINKRQIIIDLALFISQPTPSVFIYIKSIEKFEENTKEREYLFNNYLKSSGSLFSILTNGKHWKFYYFDKNENVFDECFLTLNMAENTVEEIETSLRMFLSRIKIADGSSQQDIKKILWRSNLSQVFDEVLPKAQILVNKPPYPRLPEAVVQLLTERTIKITEDEVVEFLERIKEPGNSSDDPEDTKSITDTHIPGLKPVKD